MFSISIPFSTRQERRRSGRKKRAKASGSGTTAATAAATKPPPPPRPRPAWDSTTSDLSRHRLTAAEMEFRRTLRQGRHRLHSHGEPPADGQGEEQEPAALTAEALERLQVQLRSTMLGDAAEAPAPAPTGADDCSDAGESGGGGSSSSRSLAGMRAFVADLQRKYGLAPAEPAAQHPSASGWLHEQVAAQEEELGADDDDEGEGAYSISGGASAAGMHLRHSSSPAPPAEGGAGSGSDSEGCGRLGPVALRRAQQREQRRQAAAAGAASGRPGTATAAPMAASLVPSHLRQQQALLDRLAAAEARLAELEALPAQLGEAAAAVADLRARNERLQADLDDHAGHASTLLTSLQAQLSALLARQAPGHAGAADLAAGGRVPPRAPASHVSAAPPVAVLQAQAVAEALAIAQQALSGGAAASPLANASAADSDAPTQAAQPCSAALPPLPRWRPDDALAGVQLPPFRSFAELRGQAATTPPLPSKPAPALGSAAGLPEATSGSSGGSSIENSPPQPRALPQSLAQQLGAGAPSAASAGLQWRPLASAGPQ